MLNESPQERLKHITDRLRAGSVSVRDLSCEMGVSEITIRRDLASLEREGKLLRVYGGAIPKERVAYEFSFKEKESLHREQKDSIARAAAGLVEPGAAVFLDTGTTAVAVARALRARAPEVIVTVNLCVASEYVGQERVRVIMPGGELGRRSPDLLGELALQALAQMTVDVAFLGCDSVDPAEGFYAADLRSAAVSRLMLAQCRRAYLIADSSKFGRRAMVRIAPVERLAGIVTDAGLARPYRKVIERAGVRVLIEA